MRVGLLIGAAAGAVALGACRSLPTTGSTAAALMRVGYRMVSVTAAMTMHGSEVQVHVGVPAVEEGEEGKVAGVVWTTLPFHFDRLRVVVEGDNGPVRATLTYTELVDRFGPRDPDLDRRDYSGEVGALTTQFLAGVAVPALLFAAFLGTLIVAAGRRRR